MYIKLEIQKVEDLVELLNDEAKEKVLEIDKWGKFPKLIQYLVESYENEPVDIQKFQDELLYDQDYMYSYIGMDPNTGEPTYSEYLFKIRKGDLLLPEVKEQFCKESFLDVIRTKIKEDEYFKMILGYEIKLARETNLDDCSFIPKEIETLALEGFVQLEKELEDGCSKSTNR